MKSKRWERNLTVILLWILFSLLAIAYIGDHPYLGLAIAIGGGIIMGVVAFLNFEMTIREERALQEVSGADSPEVSPTPPFPTDDPQAVD